MTREADLSRPTRHTSEATRGADDASDARTRGRTATLTEVNRLYRLIDEVRGEIESRHLQIERFQREIATLLEAPSTPADL